MTGSDNRMPSPRSLCLVAVIGLVLAPLAAAQNSTNRERPEPGAIAARAGSGVLWRAGLVVALEESRQTGKPVFWYVPTIHRSFMDRLPELDRYLMAGPFSWPRTIALLNEHYVPVKEAPDREQCRAYSIARIDFIEPGFLVLAPDGTERLRRDRISTFHPGWFLGPLAAEVGAAIELDNPFPGLLAPTVARRFFAELPARPDALPEDALENLSPVERGEALFLLGAGLLDHRREEEALAVWSLLARGQPDHPLGQKAAMEVEGHGPYARGFETFDALPAAALEFSGAGTRVAAGCYPADQVWARSCAFLVRMQRSHGGFTDSRYDFGGTDSLENVHCAVTAIAAQALLEQSARGKAADPALETAIDLALRYVANDANLNPADTDAWVWPQIYRIRLGARLLELRPHARARFLPVLETACRNIIAAQRRDGAWRHEYANPFVTASCLIALHDARRLGACPDGLDETVRRGIAVLKRCRSRLGGYSYGIARRTPREGAEGSVGRGPAGDLALHLFGELTELELAAAIERSFAHEAPLLSVRKYDDHSDLFAYGGFFFWYSMHTRADAIAALAAGEQRERLAARQRNRILELAEIDGCFVDSHELGRTYGTAMALVSLALLGIPEGN